MFMKDQKEVEILNILYIVEFCFFNEWYWGFKVLLKCGNMFYYYCLVINEGRFVEFCNESLMWIEKGNLFNYIVFNIIQISLV